MGFLSSSSPSPSTMVTPPPAAAPAVFSDTSIAMTAANQRKSAALGMVKTGDKSSDDGVGGTTKSSLLGAS